MNNELFDEGLVIKLKEKFVDLDCAQISDAAVERVFALPTTIKSRSNCIKFCGPAFPVNTENDMLPPIQALSCVPKGAVLLINNTNPMSTQFSEALIGEIYTTTAINYQAGGLIVNGAIRDIKIIKELDFPVYSTEVSFFSSKIAETPAAKIPEQVKIDDIVVNPGDWIFGDDDGLLLVRYCDVKVVLLAAEFVKKREQELISSILKGDRLEDLIGMKNFLEGKSPALRFSF